MKKPVLSNSLPALIDEIGINNGIIFSKNQDDLIKEIGNLITNKGKLKEIGQMGYNYAVKNCLWSKIIIKINEKVLEEFIPETSKFSKEYIVAPETMGNEDEFRLIIETDKTFVPSALDPSVKDDRVLGIQIFFLYFRENVK